MNKKNNRKGFTTVELVIVIAVIAILATVLIPTFSGLIGQAQESAFLSDANSIYKSWLTNNATKYTPDTVLAIVVGEIDNKGNDNRRVYLFEDNKINETYLKSGDKIPCGAYVVLAGGVETKTASDLPDGISLPNASHDFGTGNAHDCACGEPKPVSGN
jgi:prepilin-type N-terminal cleavage/methylation domain-containing protein